MYSTSAVSASQFSVGRTKNQLEKSELSAIVGVSPVSDLKSFSIEWLRLGTTSRTS